MPPVRALKHNLQASPRRALSQPADVLRTGEGPAPRLVAPATAGDDDARRRMVERNRHPREAFFVETQQPFYALTFDDGPDPQTTPRLLATLRKHGARATFYVIGEKVLRHPDILHAIIAEGHEIGNHSFSHPFLVKRMDAEILEQVDRAQNAIFDACGVLPRTFRPPHGRLNPHQREMLHFNRPLIHAYWSLDTKDWRDLDAAKMTETMVAGVTPGEIVLAHDTLESSLQATDRALTMIGARGLRSLTVSELLRL